MSLREKHEAATPGEWWWDSYSRIGAPADGRPELDAEHSLCDNCDHHKQYHRDDACHDPLESCACRAWQPSTSRDPAYVNVAWMANVPGTHGDQLHHHELQANAELIVALRNAVPELLELIEAAENRGPYHNDTCASVVSGDFCSCGQVELRAALDKLKEAGL